MSVVPCEICHWYQSKQSSQRLLSRVFQGLETRTQRKWYVPVFLCLTSFLRHCSQYAFSSLRLRSIYHSPLHRIQEWPLSLQYRFDGRYRCFLDLHLRCCHMLLPFSLVSPGPSQRTQLTNKIRFHITSNHSAEIHRRGNQLDYLGIVILMWGSTIPSVFYGFYYDPHLQKLYWFVVSHA